MEETPGRSSFGAALPCFAPGASDAVDPEDALELLAELADVQGRLDDLKWRCGSWRRRSW
jgi:hypothetical protein